MDTSEKIAAAFTALSHPRRVRIYRALRTAGASGLSHGALQNVTRLPPMTLSHHLKPMLAVGLVRRKQRGSFVFFSLNPGAVLDVVDNLASEAAGEFARRHAA